MAISYPLDLPASPAAPARVRIAPATRVAADASPFTFESTVYVHQGQIWRAEIELPPMRRAVAQLWTAWLLKLNGQQGTFRMGDPVQLRPLGAGSGTPVVDGASQTGQSLAIRGASASVTGWLKAGDYLEVDQRLYMNLNDSNTDGTGRATLDIWPRLRASPADGATVTLTKPRGRWRLALNEMPWDIRVGPIYGVVFGAVEDL